MASAAAREALFVKRVQLSDDLSISRLVYGMWRIGDDDDRRPSHVQAKLESCLSQGLTTIDQADIYGAYGAEEILGNCLKAAPHLKDKVEIISKCGIIAPIGPYSDRSVKHYDTSAAHITASVERSLRCMGIEALDVLLIHRPDPFMDPQETGAALDGLVQSGKVKAIGVSNFQPHDWELLASAMHAPLVTNQIEISLLENRAVRDGQIAFLQARGIPPMAWSPLGGGALFTHYNTALLEKLSVIAKQESSDLASVAIAWLLAHPAGIVPVMGTNRLSRIDKISAALKIAMPRELWFELYELANGNPVP
jgi:predicted oxidoreductase